MERYIIVIEGGVDNFSAYSPDIPGCVAAADTLEETLELFKAALDMHLCGMAGDGDPMPQARGIDYYLENEPDFYEADDFLTHVEVDLAKFLVPATG